MRLRPQASENVGLCRNSSSTSVPWRRDDLYIISSLNDSFRFLQNMYQLYGNVNFYRE